MKRSTALEDDVMDWLEEDDDVQEILGDTGGIVPVTVAKNNDQLDPRISVGASMTSSSRENTREEMAFEARIIVDGTRGYVKRNQVRSLKLLKDRVADVVTTHRDGWGSTGANSGEEIAWNDTVNRYLGVLSVGFERDDPHEYYD